MVFPFSGRLVNGAESFRWIRDALTRLEGEAKLCSAFIKRDALQLLTCDTPPNEKIKLLARWKPQDLISGASDLSCYQSIKKNGWKFYIKQDFHGKIYRIPRNGILVGSWNATASGFSLNSRPNDEVGTLVQETDYNNLIIEKYFEDATEVTDSLYQEISAFIEAIPIGAQFESYPESIQKKLKNSLDPLGLLTTECFQSQPSEYFFKPTSNAAKFDRNLLGISAEDMSETNCAIRIIETKIYKWLQNTITNNDGQMSFGSLSAALHSTLLDDPTPYRKDVKVLVANLFEWVSWLGPTMSNISISRPNYSQIMTLVQKKK